MDTLTSADIGSGLTLRGRDELPDEVDPAEICLDNSRAGFEGACVEEEDKEDKEEEDESGYVHLQTKVTRLK